jgi:hypothetical protein
MQGFSSFLDFREEKEREEEFFVVQIGSFHW